MSTDDGPLARRAVQPAPNALARLRAEAGADLFDLSDANPTRHGLTHPGLVDVLARAAADVGRYDPEPRGPVEARAALAARRGGAVSDYWLASSTSEAYAWLLTVLADPGGAVAVPVPGYPLVEPLARFAGLRTVGYPLFYVHPHGWAVDLDALDRALAEPGVRVLVAVSPGNPTGAYLEPAAADAMVAACARHGVALVADEVFAPFWLDRGAPAPRLGGRDEVLVAALDGLSKSLAAPQVKLGWLRLSGPVGPCTEVAAALDAVADTFLSVSAVASLALPGLLDLVDEQVGTVRARLAGNLATARDLLGAPCRVRRVDGGWTALVDVPRRRDDDALAAHLVCDAHLWVQPGWLFDLADEGALALSLLPEPDRFGEGCRRLRGAVLDG